MPSCAMRATALHPPPPTPITLILVPPRDSSSISYFRSFIFLPKVPAYRLLSSHDLPDPSPRLALLLQLRLDLRRIHRQARRHAPLGIVQIAGPVLDPHRQ